MQAVDEFCNYLCGLLWFSLKDKVRSWNLRDFNLRFDPLNRFETGSINQAILLSLDEKYRYGDFTECEPRVDCENLTKTRT